MADCLFCKIARKEIPAKLVYEDEDAVAFEDINPQAPVHVLVVPKRHIPTLNDLTPADDALVGKLARISADHRPGPGRRRGGLAQRGEREPGGRPAGLPRPHALHGRTADVLATRLGPAPVKASRPIGSCRGAA